MDEIKYDKFYEEATTVYTKATETTPATLHMTFHPGRHDHLKSEGQVLAGKLEIAFTILALELYPDNNYAQKKLIVEAAGWIANMA